MTTERFDDELLLIDLSSLAHPLFHVAVDPTTLHVTLVDRIRALASQHPHAAICVDSRTSFRKKVDPTYKANRPESDAVLHHEIAVAMDTLRGDGFPIWGAEGYEADDVVASSVYRALEIPDTTVLIASDDKDLCALVNGRVRMKRFRDGAILDEAAVYAKLNVLPRQVADYLALVGDKSDNIQGAAGIGAVKAANLLGSFGTLDDAYEALDKGEAALPPSMITSLAAFRARLPTVRQLIALKTDVPVPFEEIAVDRVPKNQEPEMNSADRAIEERREDEDMLANAASTGRLLTNSELPAIEAGVTARGRVVPQPMPRTATEVLAPAPVEFERQLEPRSMSDAKELASMMFQARLFPGYGSPQAVLSTVLAGREMGLQAIASLRSIHIVEGKHCPSADLLRALVLRSGKAKYFRPIERTPEAATFETQRGDEPPVTLRYTIEEAQQAGLVKNGSAWQKNPADMLVARASAKLARLVYPDIAAGLYDPSELDR